MAHGVSCDDDAMSTTPDPTWGRRKKKPSASPPGLSSLIRFVVLGTSPLPPTALELEVLGFDEAKSRRGVCFWCGKPLGDRTDKDHLLGVVANGLWNGLPEVTLPVHPRCNQGRGALNKSLNARDKDKDKERFAPLVAWSTTMKAPLEIVKEYNGHLATFVQAVQDAWAMFLAAVADLEHKG